MPRPAEDSAVREVSGIVRWYLANAYNQIEGPTCRPFFSDPSRVGEFAVRVEDLQARDEAAHFRLLVLLALYQSRRDVDVMTIQRTMAVRSVTALTSPHRLRTLIARSPCSALHEAGTFDERCDVYRDFARDTATCRHRPRTPCHVKAATLAIGRMGDMGKLPTSAFLHLRGAGLVKWFADASAANCLPTERADLLVARLSSIFRIGRKLATMYVSALTVPELAKAPWHPDLDGSRLVVVDANVARVISHLRRDRARPNYEAMVSWLISVAERIDLAHLQTGLPRNSPRFVQQALYVFGSRSNRAAREDTCSITRCAACPSPTCPFQINKPEKPDTKSVLPFRGAAKAE
ncbi:MAG: hypothetical protein M3680_13070 [Myxococcota bacterium]|nr:hypothetical protein [Gemmatimonadaceae bacterium]MDQ3366350.1 hypothetical protein [Myxococcota bacterium]